MPSASVQPVTITKLDDWSRLYAFDFADSFVEFQSPTAPAIVGTPTITADAGITATFVMTAGPGVYVRISGGSAGESYNLSVGVVLNTGDELSIPAVVSVVNPGPGGLAQTTLAKLPGWERHYLFPFGKVFSEFNVPVPPALSGTPIFSCVPARDGSTLSGIPQASGASAIVFISGGTPGLSYQVRCTATTSGGDTLSIPGLISD
jgi:hypothetical protein